ncbi:MAG: PASTA domain-containing protein [Gemmatimonadaceae bacterium]|nr:PASTA domain-containing protein [Gemmatimonadaceae bacterium]
MSIRAWPRRALPYLIVAVGGFLIAYLAIFLFAFPAEVIPDEGVLPNVVGLNFADAQIALEKAGFHAQQGETRFHKSVRESVVLQEDPPAGSRQKRGTDVVLAISGGQRTAEVPQLIYMTQQQAKVAIENTGLALGTITEKMSDQQRGFVVESSPPAGTKLQLPASVDIVVSKGPVALPVPDLTGRSLAEARSMLEAAGLRLGGISRDTSSINPEGTVMGQIPAPGQSVSNGGAVSVRISRFPSPTPAPSLAPDTLELHR